MDCCTGQSPGNEITVLQNLQAKGGVAKSKPCSSRRGWGSARGGAGSRGMWAKSFLRGGKPSMLLWDDVSLHNIVGGTLCLEVTLMHVLGWLKGMTQ